MKRDAGKEQFWRKTMAEASGSGQSVRAFCRQRGLKEAHFYGWRRELKKRDADAAGRSGFVELVRTGDETGSAGVTLHLDERISIRLDRGFDAMTLKAALAVVCEVGRA